MSSGVLHEQPARPRLRTGWSLSCAALLLLAVALGPALRDRAERRRLAESDARAVALQVDALRLRLARARGELRDWGADLLLGRVGAPAARRAAAGLIAELPELRALERVDTGLALRETWPAERRRVTSGAALPPGPARDAAERALRSGFPATTPVFEAPGDGPSVTTWVPVLDGTRVLGLVGGSFALDALLRSLHAPGDARTRLELVDAGGKLLASAGDAPDGAETGATSLALQPFGLPLRLSVRRESVAPALLPSAATALALLTALALVAHVMRRRFAWLAARSGPAQPAERAPTGFAFVTENPAALALFGRDRRCLASSRRWRELLALRDDDVVGRPFHALVPGGAEHWRGAFERGLRGARERRGDERLTLANGRHARISWSLGPWTDARGRVGGVCLHLEAFAPEHVPGARCAPDAEAVATANGRHVASTGADHAAEASPPPHPRAPLPAHTRHGPPLPVDGVTDELHADARAALLDLRRAQAELGLGEHDADSWRARELRVTPETALAADVAYLQREQDDAGRAAPHGRVLVAEHDPDARAFAERVLVAHGYAVLFADDAANAVEQLRGKPSEVLCVLLALDLPGRDALSTLQQLRRLRADLPVLLVQPPGLARPPRHEERDGCALLRRPYRAAQLLRACRRALSARASVGRAYLPAGGEG